MVINKISDAAKILIIAATIIITCVIVALGFKLVNEGRSSTSNSVNQFNNMASEYSDIRLTNYDGSNVLGSEIVELIRKAEEKKYEFTITVQTKANANSTPAVTRVYNGPTPLAIETDIRSNDYINPNAQFFGEITKNDNGLVVDISFKQMN